MKRITFFFGLILFITTNTFSITEEQFESKIIKFCTEVAGYCYPYIKNDEIILKYTATTRIKPLFKRGGRFNYINYKDIPDDLLEVELEKEFIKTLDTLKFFHQTKYSRSVIFEWLRWLIKVTAHANETGYNSMQPSEIIEL